MEYSNLQKQIKINFRSPHIQPIFKTDILFERFWIIAKRDEIISFGTYGVHMLGPWFILFVD